MTYQIAFSILLLVAVIVSFNMMGKGDSEK